MLTLARTLPASENRDLRPPYSLEQPKRQAAKACQQEQRWALGRNGEEKPWTRSARGSGLGKLFQTHWLAQRHAVALSRLPITIPTSLSPPASQKLLFDACSIRITEGESPIGRSKDPDLIKQGRSCFRARSFDARTVWNICYHISPPFPRRRKATFLSTSTQQTPTAHPTGFLTPLGRLSHDSLLPPHTILSSSNFLPTISCSLIMREYQFPGSLPRDADQENHLNYMIWKTQQERRKRELRTQFNRFRSHNVERLFSHQQYKDMSEQQFEALRQELETKLDTACGCDTCHETQERRKSSPDPAAIQKVTQSLQMTPHRNSRTRSVPTSS